MSWKNSWLWKTIEDRKTETVFRTLDNCLPEIELVLRSGGTSPPDFTLHDDQHSYRVAERIFALGTPEILQLSDNELALLLLGAYLHDIGMSPSRQRVKNHHQYLLTAEDGLLNPIERQELQSWLDENWNGVVPPVKGSSSSELNLADEICSYYCRARHNDWSEDWIKENLEDKTPGLYPGWIDDLVTLCKSHHQGLADLLDSRFDARLVGNPGNPLNLRFLAALLRVADVMEFDPERTPQVIMRHRQISSKSRIFWYRDHAISFLMESNKAKIILSARTPNAVIHKAVLSISDYVNVELATCHQLEQQGAFLPGFIPDTERAKYQWRLPTALVLDVKEKDDSFVYIDGTFRPDVQRLLGLLSGTALYGTPLAALRELIQNAADAIAEQIAYERLQQTDAENPTYETIFAALHKITLSFVKDGDHYWLRCNDDGIGLSRKLIETRLLRSGSNERPDFLALQRDPQSKKFEVFRTGQFGIGLLSYFMIADRVEIETRRSPIAKDGGDGAWKFCTVGVDGFGELSRSKKSKNGTEVRLRLRPEIIGSNAAEWFDRSLTYVKDTVCHLPCKLEFRDNHRTQPIQWVVDPGWTANIDQLREWAFEESVVDQGRPGETPEEKRERNERKAEWDQIRTRSLERISWFGPVYLDTGPFFGRCWIPYFESTGGPTLALIELSGSKIEPLFSTYDALQVDGHIRLSWKGFRVESHIALHNALILEVDVRYGSEIAISRNRLKLENENELYATTKRKSSKRIPGLTYTFKLPLSEPIDLRATIDKILRALPAKYLLEDKKRQRGALVSSILSLFP